LLVFAIFQKTRLEEKLTCPHEWNQSLSVG
jgi:hypothetical protein